MRKLTIKPWLTSLLALSRKAAPVPVGVLLPDDFVSCCILVLCAYIIWRPSLVLCSGLGGSIVENTGHGCSLAVENAGRCEFPGCGGSMAFWQVLDNDTNMKTLWFLISALLRTNQSYKIGQPMWFPIPLLLPTLVLLISQDKRFSAIHTYTSSNRNYT